MKEEWINELTLDLVPEGICQEIAEEIGIENMLKLCTQFGGSTLYMPKRDSVIRELRNRRICEEFNGYNKKELCKKYQVSGRWIDEIISRN